MIEKLLFGRDGQRPEPASTRELQIKLNELVDAVNRHEDIIRQIGEWGSSKGECLWCENLTRVNLDDPYAEQRKCLCKLCWFWNDDETSKVIGILTGVFDEADRPFERNINQTLYKHCEPVKPDDDIIYRGE